MRCLHAAARCGVSTTPARGEGRIEIIFCSADNDTASFLSYFQKQPWLAIPNGDQLNADLQKLFGVEGYPTLVVVDAHTGELITTKARMNVMSDPKGDGFPWVPKAAVDADAEGPDGINETPSLCVLLDGCDAEARVCDRCDNTGCRGARGNR